MTTVIACFVAGISITAFFTLWFIVAYREIENKKQVLDDLAEQIKIYGSSEPTQSETENTEAARVHMLETGTMLYNEAAKSYNRLLRHPFYWFPGFVLRFRRAKTTNELILRKEK